MIANQRNSSTYFTFTKHYELYRVVTPSGSSGTKICRAEPSVRFVSPHPELFCCVPNMHLLQVGHDDRAISHRSMHRTWKPWLHLGKTLTRSPGSKSHRQIAQIGFAAFKAKLAEYIRIGIVCRVFLLNPDWVSRVTGFGSGSESDILLEQRRAHRTIELSPSAQIRAHKRTARIMTTFASKLLLVCALESGVSRLEDACTWFCPVGGLKLYMGLWRRILLEWRFVV